MQIVRTHANAKALPKPRACSSHGLGIAKHNPSLIARCSKRVNLGTPFAVCSQHVKAHGRRQRRLGITPGHFDVGAPKPALAIGFDPSKHGGENKRLPGFKGNRLTRKRPFDVR